MEFTCDKAIFTSYAVFCFHIKKCRTTCEQSQHTENIFVHMWHYFVFTCFNVYLDNRQFVIFIYARAKYNVVGFSWHSQYLLKHKRHERNCLQWSCGWSSNSRLLEKKIFPQHLCWAIKSETLQLDWPKSWGQMEVFFCRSLVSNGSQTFSPFFSILNNLSLTTETGHSLTTSLWMDLQE